MAGWDTLRAAISAGFWVCALLRVQKVKASLPTHADNVVILPFDLCGNYEALEKAAAAADAAFDGAGVDFLIHNAGESGVGAGSTCGVAWRLGKFRRGGGPSTTAPHSCSCMVASAPCTCHDRRMWLP